MNYDAFFHLSPAVSNALAGLKGKHKDISIMEAEKIKEEPHSFEEDEDEMMDVLGEFLRDRMIASPLSHARKRSISNNADQTINNCHSDNFANDNSNKASTSKQFADIANELLLYIQTNLNKGANQSVNNDIKEEPVWVHDEYQTFEHPSDQAQYHFQNNTKEEPNWSPEVESSILGSGNFIIGSIPKQYEASHPNDDSEGSDDSRDEPVDHSHKVLLIPATEQSVDVSTTSKISVAQRNCKNIPSSQPVNIVSRVSFDAQKQCKKMNKNEENTNGLHRVASGGNDKHVDRITDSSSDDSSDSKNSNNSDDSIHEPVNDNSKKVSPAPASKLLDHVETTYRISSRAQLNWKTIGSDQILYDAAANNLSFIPQKKLNQNEDSNDDNVDKVTDDSDNSSDSDGSMDEPVEDNSQKTSLAPASKQLVHDESTIGTSSGVQEDWDKIEIDQSVHVATANRLSNKGSKGQRTDYHSDDSSDSDHSMDEPVGDNSQKISLAPASKQLVHDESTIGTSSGVQEDWDKIEIDQSVHVATANRLSNKGSKGQRTDYHSDDSSDSDHSMDEPVEDNSQKTSLAPASKQLVHDESTIGTSSGVQEDWDKIEIDQSVHVATANRLSNKGSKGQRTDYHSDDSSDSDHSMDEPVGDNSQKISLAPAGKQLVHIGSTIGRSSDAQENWDEIEIDQSLHVATANGFSFLPQNQNEASNGNKDHGTDYDSGDSGDSSDSDDSVGEPTHDSNEGVEFDSNSNHEEDQISRKYSNDCSDSSDSDDSVGDSTHDSNEGIEFDSNSNHEEDQISRKYSSDCSDSSDSDDSNDSDVSVDKLEHNYSRGSSTPTSGILSDLQTNSKQIASDQSVNVTTADRISFDTQNKQKKVVKDVDVATTEGISSVTQKEFVGIASYQPVADRVLSDVQNQMEIDQYIEGTCDLLAKKVMDKVSRTGKNRGWKIDDRNSMNESILDQSRTAPHKSTSEQSVFIATTTGTHRNLPKIASYQSIDVITANRVSYDKQKQMEVDQHVEIKNNLLRKKETDKFNTIHRNENSIINDLNWNGSIRDYCKTPSIRYANEQPVDTPASGLVSENQKHTEIGHPLENEDNLLSGGETDEFDNIGENDESSDGSVDEQAQDHFNRPNISASQQSINVATTTNITDTQKRKRVATDPPQDVAAADRTSFHTQKKQKIIDQNEECTNVLFRMVCNKLMQERDEFDSIGDNLAAKLRSVDASQRIMAEKLISDVLYHAQMNTLTPNTIFCKVPPTAKLPPQVYQTMSFKEL